MPPSIPTASSLFSPQWYCVRHVSSDEETFFDTVEEAMESMLVEDCGPASPHFTVHEADVEFVKRDRAHASTIVGQWQIGQRGKAARRAVVYALTLAIACFALYKGAQSVNAGIECRIESGELQERERS